MHGHWRGRAVCSRRRSESLTRLCKALARLRRWSKALAWLLELIVPRIVTHTDYSVLQLRFIIASS
jgi:hypothetical protein